MDRLWVTVSGGNDIAVGKMKENYAARSRSWNIKQFRIHAGWEGPADGEWGA